MAKKQKVNSGALLLATALEAEGASGHFAEVVRSIYQQESGSGANTTTSNAGAVGGAQILPATFNSVADPGWNIKDPLQNLRAGIRYARQGYKESGGDAALTSVFYYGGPGGMAKAKNGIAVFDPKNPNAPSTLQYGAQVAGRVVGTALAQPEAPADTQAYIDSVFKGELARTSVAAPAPLVMDDRRIKPTTETALNTAPAFDTLRTEQQAAAKVINDQTFGDTFNAARSKQMQPAFNFIAGLSEPNRHKPDATWMTDYHKDPLPKLAGYTGEEQESLLEAVNQQDYDNRVFNIGEDRANDKVINRAGVPTQIAAGLLAGISDPVAAAASMGVGLGMSAAGVGAVAFARAGRPVAAAVASTIENAAGNVAYTAVQQAVLGEHKSIHDYAMDAAIGVVFSGISAPLAYRAGNKALLETALKETTAKRAAIMDQAIRNVGDNASPEVLAAELKRIEAAEVISTHQAITSSPAGRDRLEVPNLDEVAPEKVDAPTVSNDLPPSQRLGAVQDAAPERFEAYVTRVDPALTVAKVTAQEPGVHLAPSVKDDFVFQQAKTTVQKLVDEFLPGQSLTIARAVESTAPSGRKLIPDGSHLQISGKAGILTVNPGEHMVSTIVHEIGHAVEKVHLAAATPEVQAGVKAAFNDWLAAYKAPKKATAALLQRGPLSRFATVSGIEDTTASLRDAMSFKSGDAYADAYYNKFTEFMAEQFNKYVQAGAQGAGPAADIALPKQVVDYALRMMKKLVELFVKAQDANLLRADSRVETFFEGVRAAVSREAVGADATPDFSFNQGPARPSGKDLGPQPSRGDPASLEIAKRYGLDMMPQSTPRERAEYATVVNVIKQAEAWDKANPTNPDRLKMLGNNKLFSTALPATVLASSNHPVARMIAGTVLEQTTGASGRRQTAAVAAAMKEVGYVGDAVTHYDQAYKLWSKEIGGSVAEETFKGQNRQNFNRMVMSERESRLRGQATNPHPQVAKAATVMDEAFERARIDQVKTKTIGWARLPDSAVGYTPHRLAAAKMTQMTTEQLRVFGDALTEQFKLMEGMDEPFAIELAKKYLDHARVRANGGHDIPANVHDPAAADMVRGALEAMNLPKDEVAAAMGRYAAGGPAHTKKRLHLDLNTKYDDGKGGTIQLMDLFETDQLGLLRNYSRRVGGEVALAESGIMGAQGLKLVRRAMEFGPGGVNPPAGELQAFDQVAAELLGQPFGSQGGKVLDRVLTANSLAKLGGMVYPQIGETINMVWGVGFGNTLRFIGSAPRLWSEVHALAKGKKVTNGLLDSVEQFGGGGEFGLEGYKMVTAYDSVDNAFQTYTHDSITWFDRALRSGSNLQKMLSMHRMTQAIQVRGVAEQIIHKAVKYIRDGKESKALLDMGFTPEVQAAIRTDLPNMVVYDGLGRIKEFDITKAKDIAAASAFTQAVHRGAGQIIQRSYIGEHGKWVHEGYLRVLTQFKNYPLVAMEKQWARNRNNYGTAGALGILLGSSAAVMPLYYARVAMNSVGRPDREEYLDKMLAPEMVARAALNYVGSAGMAGEFTDLLTGATGIGAPTGGRTGGNKSFVATAIPAAGFVDDLATAAKEPIQAAIDENKDYDPLTLIKTLPFNRTPGFIPAINALRGD